MRPLSQYICIIYQQNRNAALKTLRNTMIDNFYLAFTKIDYITSDKRKSVQVT